MASKDLPMNQIENILQKISRFNFRGGEMACVVLLQHLGHEECEVFLDSVEQD